MLNIKVTTIEPELNKKIKKVVYAEKHKWKKDLNNVKALTSGFNPDYTFFNELYDFSFNYLKKYTQIKLNKSWWWANYYSKDHHCNPHNHEPELLSCILIVKSSPDNPLYFINGDKKYFMIEEDGMIIFFDSKYKHGVKKCKHRRITCALDFK